jgi:hypothetical protein
LRHSASAAPPSSQNPVLNASGSSTVCRHDRQSELFSANTRLVISGSCDLHSCLKQDNGAVVPPVSHKT